jgi:monoamine oxidase
MDAAGLRTFRAARELAERRIAMAPPGASLADCLPVPPSPDAGPWAWNDRVFAGPWLCGTDCRDTDAADWAAASQGEDWLLPDGYGTLVQQLAASVPATTGCRLEALEIGADSVDLMTACGRFSAAHVVLTVPLGVLQAERIRFRPALPATHLQTLDQLSMSRLMKIGLDLLSDPFGETEGYFLHYPASDETAVLYLMQPCGKPMAYAFVGGSAARALERAADSDVRDAVLAPLRRLLGSTTVERTYGGAVVTRWADDPFALGSYSIAKPGGAAARAVLAEPILDRVFLAGEATALDGWYGTAGGAWRAGRAAVAAIDRARRLT